MSRPTLDHPLVGLPVAMIDTETTGIDFVAGVHVVSIAVVHCTVGSDAEPEVVFDAKVRPPVPIPAEASKVHGITDADVVDAPTWTDVRAAMIPHVIGRIPAAFNAAYDYRVIAQEQARIGRPPLAWPWLDVAAPANVLDRYEKGKRLVDVGRRRGFVVDAHGAAADAMLAALLLPRLLEEGAKHRRIEQRVPKAATLGAYLEWQRATSLAREADLVAYFARQGRRDPVDCPWHELEGVPAPAAPAPAEPTGEPQRCRSCGSLVVWGVTANGKPVPLDTQVHDVVTLEASNGDPEITGRESRARYLVGFDLDARPVRGHVLPDGMRPELPRVRMRVSHFATCPNADSHRKKDVA